jgi:hypothetical protein
MGLFKGRVGNMRSDRRRQGWNGMECVYTRDICAVLIKSRDYGNQLELWLSLRGVCVCLTEDEIGV